MTQIFIFIHEKMGKICFFFVFIFFAY